VAETASGIRHSEPGTLVYVPHRIDGEPRQRIFYGLYSDRAERQPDMANDLRLVGDRIPYDRKPLSVSQADFAGWSAGPKAWFPRSSGASGRWTACRDRAPGDRRL
jgi:hypothetical protein